MILGGGRKEVVNVKIQSNVSEEILNKKFVFLHLELFLSTSLYWLKCFWCFAGEKAGHSQMDSFYVCFNDV